MSHQRYGAHRAFLSWNDDHISPLSLRTVRWLTVVALGGFLLSRIFERAMVGTVFDGLASLVGLFSVFATILALGSRAQRIFVEDSARLDEYQRSRRNAAVHKAYTVLSAIVVSAGLYAWLAREAPSLPVPASEVLAELTVGAMLLAILLPVTILAWTLDLSEDPDAAEDEDA